MITVRGLTKRYGRRIAVENLLVSFAPATVARLLPFNAGCSSAPSGSTTGM